MRIEIIIGIAIAIGYAAVILAMVRRARADAERADAAMRRADALLKFFIGFDAAAKRLDRRSTDERH